MLDSVNPATIIGGAIAIYEDVWDGLAEDIEIINNISSDQESSSYFSNATIKSEINNNLDIHKTRTNQILDLTKHSQNDLRIKKINYKFNKIINDYLNKYRETFKIYEQLICAESNNLLKYTDSQHYKAHYDGDTSSKRVVSPILYLNDNYEGGEIEFVNFGIKVKPKAGSLFIFPSNYAYTHIAHPVVSGSKYAIVTWVHDC